VDFAQEVADDVFLEGDVLGILELGVGFVFQFLAAFGRVNAAESGQFGLGQ